MVNELRQQEFKNAAVVSYVLTKTVLNESENKEQWKNHENISAPTTIACFCFSGEPLLKQHNRKENKTKCK